VQGKNPSIGFTGSASAAIFALLTIALLTTSSAASVQEKLLHSFTPQGSDGAGSNAGLISDAAGNRYGTTYSGGTYNAGTVFELSPREGGGWTERVLYNFKTFGSDGIYPEAGLVLDAQGNLYGTTTGGGANCAPNGCGTVFELSPNGSGGWTEQVLHSFNQNGADGSAPIAGLVLDAARNLYGTTQAGGSHNGGTVFEMSPRHGGGWTEQVLYSFDPNGTDAFDPTSSLTFDAHGNLYGVSQSGGASVFGAAYELSPRQGGGWTEAVLYSFCSQTNCADGSQPISGGLVLDAAGNLYGTTTSGGAYNAGTAFELSPAHGGGWTEAVLHSFGEGTDGNNPGWATLVLGPDDHLFGTTTNGGLYNRGTVFELSPKRGGGWTETILHSFANTGIDGWVPYAGLMLDEYGNLYGTTAGGGGGSVGVTFELSPRGGGRWKYAVLYSFNFNGTDGSNPEYGRLILDAEGNLYGTTVTGGTYDGGTAFELKPNANGSWTEEVLYNFGGTSTAPIAPLASLIFDGHGNLYGTSAGGGTYGQGTVFELSPNGSGGWTEQALHSFQNNGTDGYQPFASLVFDATGNLYGTTYVGGRYGLGTVFELSPNGSGGWTEQVLHSFDIDGLDGILPYAGLIIDSAGNLYGTTWLGGVFNQGTVFELSPNGQGGWLDNILYSFCTQGGCTDGSSPYGSLIFDAAHNLYGTTSEGGGNAGGTVFELTPQNGSWTESVIYNFCAQTNCADGAYPTSSLTFFGSSANLYGTTYSGGANSNGAVFELTPTQGGNWTETVLHSFNLSGGDGAYPYAGVSFDPSGNLYGMTYYGGGNYNAGTMFELENVSRRLLDVAPAIRR